MVRRFNSVSDVILRNNSGILFTLQATQAGTMGVVLGDVTDNKIYIDGAAHHDQQHYFWRQQAYSGWCWFWHADFKWC